MATLSEMHGWCEWHENKDIKRDVCFGLSLLERVHEATEYAHSYSKSLATTLAGSILILTKDLQDYCN